MTLIVPTGTVSADDQMRRALHMDISREIYVAHIGRILNETGHMGAARSIAAEAASMAAECSSIFMDHFKVPYWLQEKPPCDSSDPTKTP